MQEAVSTSKDPPQLLYDLPSISDIQTTEKEPQLPVDILLLTVADDEFLACYQQLKNPYRWWFDGLGFVYFEKEYETQKEKVKIALLKCYGGSVGAGGSLISVKNAVIVLRPKAVISVGACSGLNSEKTKLGDVVVSSKLTTYASKVVMCDQEQSTGMRTYVSKHFLDVIKNCADGWQAPLKNADANQEVKVYCGEILSGPEQIQAECRRDQLAKCNLLAMAVEMEGEGVCHVLSCHIPETYAFLILLDMHMSTLVFCGITRKMCEKRNVMVTLRCCLLVTLPSHQSLS